MKYETILAIKETEKATVVLATLEGHQGPVVVKRLKGGKTDIYRLLCHARNSFFPEIYEIEEKDGELFVAEEHIAGVPLNEVLEKDMLSDGEKVSIVLQLCDAVAFLHGLNPPVIHRDIKPSNILVTKGGTIKLIDFDASRQYKKEQTSGDTRLLGTAEYAPPEQFGYAQTDVRSDIYSMGVVFREIRFKKKRLQRKWDKIVRKCTNFAPEHRYQSVEELKREIERMRMKTGIPIAVISGWAAAACLLGCLLWNMQEDETDGAPTGVPTPTEMLSPGPEEWITPEPTPTMAPTNTPTPTTAPQEALTPEEIERYQAQIEKYLVEENRPPTQYYRGSGELMLYSSLFETRDITEVEFIDFMTGERVLLQGEDFIFENSIVRIPEESLDVLGEYYYEMKVIGYYESGQLVDFNMVCKVNPEEENPEWKLHIKSTDLLYDDTKHETLHVIMQHASERKIVGLCVGRVIEVDRSLYTILYDGKAMELSKELLSRYLGEESVDFYVVLDDGTKERVTIEFPQE